MKRAFVRIIILSLSVMAVAGCDKKSKQPENSGGERYVDPDALAKKYLKDECIDIYYYWADDVRSKNKNISPLKYSSIVDYFDALLFAKDHWSWMCGKDEYISSETGVQTGTWGASFGQLDADSDSYAIRIRYIYPGSPLAQFGVTRGARLDAIGGVDITDPFTQDKLEAYNREIVKESTSFTFHLADGRDTTFTATRASTLATSPCLVSRVFTGEDFEGLTEPVGYFHFLGFKQEFLGEVCHVFDSFKEAGVKKLILDFRYNGGGDLSVSDVMMSYVAPASAVNKVYNRLTHNALLTGAGWNEDYVIAPNENNLDPDDVYFIVGSGSASASELLINSLKPFMKEHVHIVGQQSYGKPNGMYVLYYPGTDADYDDYRSGNFGNLKYVFLPIAFYNLNALGEQIPDEGLTPDKKYLDDLFHDFGVEEQNIQGCLYHIVNGSYPEQSVGEDNTSTKSVSRGVLLPEEPDNNIGGCYKVLPLERIRK